MYTVGEFLLGFFTSTNGVKQGGILSPLFFNVYMDNLSAQLNSQHIGCSTGDVVVKCKCDKSITH